jgi:hypothetical protein
MIINFNEPAGRSAVLSMLLLLGLLKGTDVDLTQSLIAVWGRDLFLLRSMGDGSLIKMAHFVAVDWSKAEYILQYIWFSLSNESIAIAQINLTFNSWSHLILKNAKSLWINLNYFPKYEILLFSLIYIIISFYSPQFRPYFSSCFSFTFKIDKSSAD